MWLWWHHDGIRTWDDDTACRVLTQVWSGTGGSRTYRTCGSRSRSACKAVLISSIVIMLDCKPYETDEEQYDDDETYSEAGTTTGRRYSWLYWVAILVICLVVGCCWGHGNMIPQNPPIWGWWDGVHKNPRSKAGVFVCLALSCEGT